MMKHWIQYYIKKISPSVVIAEIENYLRCTYNVDILDDKTNKRGYNYTHTVYSSNFGSDIIIFLKNRQHDVLSDALYNERSNVVDEEKQNSISFRGNYMNIDLFYWKLSSNTRGLYEEYLVTTRDITANI